MGRAGEPERVALTVPLAAVGSSSPRRTRLVVAIWAIGLAGIAWVGLVSHDGEVVVVAEAPVAAVPLAAQATAAPSLARAQTRDPAPAIVLRRTFGEDGLVGGIVFGDNVPVLSQADIERDGYRYFQGLIARHPGAGRQGPP